MSVMSDILAARNLYAVDGQCHNAEPGTYGHECGKPAVWLGLLPSGSVVGYCDDCKQRGAEGRRCTAYQLITKKGSV